MNNDQSLNEQVASNTRRLDELNASQTIPLPVDLAWQNRGFVKTNFFVAGTSSFNTNGEFRLVIPGSSKNSIALVTGYPSSTFQPLAQMTQSYAQNNFGDSTTQFDITNPAGATFRYTYDGNGTNPNINATTIPVGSRMYVFSSNFNPANTNNTTNPFFIVTGSGTNYFEVTNATPGVAQNNVTIGSGGITGGPLTNTYELYALGVSGEEFSFVVFLFDRLFIQN